MKPKNDVWWIIRFCFQQVPPPKPPRTLLRDKQVAMPTVDNNAESPKQTHEHVNWRKFIYASSYRFLNTVSRKIIFLWSWIFFFYFLINNHNMVIMFFGMKKNQHFSYNPKNVKSWEVLGVCIKCIIILSFERLWKLYGQMLSFLLY